MSAPRVINKKTATAAEQAEAVYIGRGGKWGNPFVIGRDGTLDYVIAKYERHLLSSPALTAALGELRGRVLMCWCAPLGCHGDVLMRHANGPIACASVDEASATSKPSHPFPAPRTRPGTSVRRPAGLHPPSTRRRDLIDRTPSREGASDRSRGAACEAGGR